MVQGVQPGGRGPQAREPPRGPHPPDRTLRPDLAHPPEGPAGQRGGHPGTGSPEPPLRRGQLHGVVSPRVPPRAAGADSVREGLWLPAAAESIL
eukprot:scaffold262163_cov45-Prasinocladus_malaysianus.AAC.1